MNKLLFFSIALILINYSVYAQNERIIIANKATIDSIAKEIAILNNNYDRIKVEVDLANRIIEKNNNTVDWSGYIGMLVTALLFGFGALSYFSFTSSKKEVNLLIKQADERLNKAEAQFNSFVNSPEKINNLFEDLYFKQIEKEIDSDNEKVFIQGLYRANILGKVNKQSIARRIKEKLYNPDFWKHDRSIYLFLRENLDKKPEELAAEVVFRKTNSLGTDLLFLTAEDLYCGKSKPFQIEPLEYFNNSTEKSLAISYLKRFLEVDTFYRFLNCIVKDKKSILYLNVNADYDKNRLTQIFADNIYEIDPERFNNFSDWLSYDEKIFTCKIKEKPDLKVLHYYVKKNLTDISKFIILFNLLNLDLPETWIELLKLSTPISEIDKIQFLKKKYNEITVPNGMFFKEDLPLLLSVNYGVIKKDEDYYFNDQKLKLSTSYVDSKPDLQVYLPILNRNISTSKIYSME